MGSHVEFYRFCRVKKISIKVKLTSLASTRFICSLHYFCDDLAMTIMIKFGQHCLLTVNVYLPLLEIRLKCKILFQTRSWIMNLTDSIQKLTSSLAIVNKNGFYIHVLELNFHSKRKSPIILTMEG